MLYPSFHLFALVRDGLARLCLERGCLVVCRANGFLDPLIDSSDATDVRSTLNADAEILPVLIGAVPRSSLDLAVFWQHGVPAVWTAKGEGGVLAVLLSSLLSEQ